MVWNKIHCLDREFHKNTEYLKFKLSAQNILLKVMF